MPPRLTPWWLGQSSYTDGTLDVFTNHLDGTSIEYEYDIHSRLVSSSETNSSDPSYINDYRINDYDSEGRVVSSTNSIDYLVASGSSSVNVGKSYAYNNNGTLKDERINCYAVPSTIIDYHYDCFNRVTKVDRRIDGFRYKTEYTFYRDSYDTNNLVSQVTNTINGSSTTYNYTYDTNGNITKIVKGSSETTYTYDDLGQLIREQSGITTKNYTYDNAGNITAIQTVIIEPIGDNDFVTYALKPLPGITTTTTIPLSYTDSQWGDLLTSYNGTTITYDEIGNPLSYYNGSAYTFTWEGRRLVGATKGSTNMSFTYDDNGIRTSKTVNGVTHNYYLNGSQIVAEEWGDKLLVYLYDASGSPIGMMFRKTSYDPDQWDVYWFEKNLQGDIVAVYNSNGQQEAYYSYNDAWGNHTAYVTTTATEGAQYNPFRYRGYYYDTDLGLYYLQSRYYDSNTCRFISPDTTAVLTATPMALTDKNLYAYCDNNPVMRVDEDGEFWLQFGIGAAVGFVSGVIDFLQSGEELSWIEVAKIGVSTLSGGVTAVVGPVAGALISGIACGVNSALSGNDSEEIIVDTFVGALTSGIGSGMQLATGRILAGNFVQSASKTKLKMFANSLGYVGRNYKNALSWTGEIMYDASVEYMDKPISQFVGYSIAFVSERINALIPR